MSYASLLCSIALVAWAATMRALTGTWLQPSAFFALWWCFAGILPLLLAPQEHVGVNAIVWLVVASIAVSIGGVIGNWGFRTRRIAIPPATTHRELTVFGFACVTSIILGIVSTVAFVVGTGISFADLFDIEKLVVVSNQAYFARYSETPLQPPLLSQALLPFVYLAPVTGGVLFVLGRRARYKLIGIAAFLPATTVTVLQTTKAAVLLAMILWLSSYFATRLRQGRLAVFTRTHALVGLGVGASVTVFFFAVGLARLATTDVTLVNVVFGKLVTSAFGHMAVFSQWLTAYQDQPFSPDLGTVTFAGPREMLGLGQRIPGLFENVIDLVTGETSNIYTAFRPLIQDFTMAGALAILALVGVVGGAGFRLAAAGRWTALPLLIIAYVTIFWTPITWIWIYNSVTATLLATAVIVMFIRIWRGTRRFQRSEA